MMAEENINVADNVGFSMKALEVFKLLSDELDKEEEKLLRKKLQNKFNKGIGSGYNILEKDEMSYIYDYFLESNTKLADLYWEGNSFSEPEFSSPKKFDKNQMYQQLIVDLIKNEHRLKSELKTYRSSITNRIIKKIKRISTS